MLEFRELHSQEKVLDVEYLKCSPKLLPREMEGVFTYLFLMVHI